MASNAPSKITLSSNTSVSLHDRFTKLAKAKPVSSEPRPGSAQSRAFREASLKNRKLALQMGERPSVQAALKLKNAIKKPSLNQRLGNARIDSSRLGNRRGPPTIQGPPQRQKPSFAQQRVGNNIANERVNNKAISRVPRGGIGLKNRIKFVKANNLKQRINQQRQAPAPKKKPQFKKPANKPKEAVPAKNKETLDMDLDSYMSKSKGHLDSDLDAYMAQSN